MRRLFAVLLVLALCAGLWGIHPVSAQMIGGSTSSGQPQITIRNTTVGIVKAALRKRLDEQMKLNKKATLSIEETSNTLKLTGQNKIPTGSGIPIPMGQAAVQFIFEITAVGKDVLVVVDANAVSRPGEPSETVVRGYVGPQTPSIRGLLDWIQRDIKPSGAEKTYKDMNAWFGTAAGTDLQVKAVDLACPKSWDHKGLCIIGIYPDSPAFHAGLKAKDVLISFNGKPTRSQDEFTAALATARIGQSVPVVYARDGQTKTTKAALVLRPEELPRF
jgi:S1-C subfamily serine protease